MATDYPIEITDPDGSVRLAGLADFTDPDNQPAGVNQPFRPVSGESVTVVEDADGDPVYVYDDDAGSHDFTGKGQFSGTLKADGNFASFGETDLGNNGPADTIGFFGAVAITQPQVPATPLPQDIVDALVALGLVSQAS